MRQQDVKQESQLSLGKADRTPVCGVPANVNEGSIQYC